MTNRLNGKPFCKIRFLCYFNKDDITDLPMVSGIELLIVLEHISK
jgi:hypothetical protein